MGIVHGKKLMVFIEDGSEYVSVGYCTNHTLSTSASTIDIAHKDLEDAGSGKWDDQDIDTFSWTITSEAFYANEADGYTFADLFNYYSTGAELNLKFGVAADSTTGVPTGGWSPSTTILSGKAIITSIDVNASVSEKASYSVTFTGKGALTAETPANPDDND